MVIAEATYLVQRKLGSEVEVRFLEAIIDLELEAPLASDWPRIAQLAKQYVDLRLGGTDASVIATAERLAATKIITLDRKHFSVVQPKHIEAFELLPA
jgi:predicted nucleic acid-binding protein